MLGGTKTARTGFEVTWFPARADGWLIEGTPTAVEDGVAPPDFKSTVDSATGSCHQTDRKERIAADERGLPGSRPPAPHLDGHLELGSPPMTSTFPVHGLAG